jgi:uncharacterized membrane protein YeaQ/YmgE (transglycosylase-associated protein family)
MARQHRVVEEVKLGALLFVVVVGIVVALVGTVGAWALDQAPHLKEYAMWSAIAAITIGALALIFIFGLIVKKLKELENS